MSIKKYSLLLIVSLISELIFAANISNSFELSPGESTTLEGYINSSKKIVCSLDSQQLSEEKILNFLSLEKKCIINNLYLDEGAMMTLAFSHFEEGFNFELEPEARLEITNGSAEQIKLHCNH